MQEKKKILYAITKGNFGGAQKYVYDLAVNLPRSSFDVVLACGNKEGDSLPQRLAEQNVKTITLESLEREINIKNDLKALAALVRIIKVEKPDVVHLNSSKIGLLGSLAILYLKILNLFRISGFGFRTCAVFTAHGWAFNEKNRGALSRFVFYLGHYLTILICDTTIAVSEKAKKDVACLPFTKNKVKVVYNGISVFDTLPKNEARSALAGKDSDKIILFSLSELHKNKGIDVALSALSLLPAETKRKVVYSIAGDGEEKQNLEKLVLDLKIKEVVRFLGFVPDAKRLLAGADIFLLPSRTEALPYSLLEAGAAGVPAIATCVGGVSEVIHDMQNGILVHRQNPKEMAEAVMYMIDHPDKQKEFGTEIKKTVDTFFTLEKMVSETLKIYDLKIN